MTRRAVPRPGVTAFRPSFELLEAREVPAVVVWHGAVSTDAGNVANWDLDFYGNSLHQLPAAGDEVNFAPPGVYDPKHPGINQAAINCVGFHGNFNSVYVDPDYTARITLDGEQYYPAALTSGDRWLILESEDGIVRMGGAPALTNTTLWGLEVDNNNAPHELYLKAK